MPSSLVKIGPFVGGLNTYSDPTAVDDSEVTQLVNFEVDLDGSLVSRPPITMVTVNPTALPLRLLGYFLDASGTPYLLGADDTSTYYLSNTNMWVLITNTFGASSFVQYANKVWLTAPVESSASSGRWDPVNGFVAIAAMKKGSTSLVYKERMFIAEGGTSITANRVYFSNPGNFEMWTSSDFLDVRTGDGQEIQEMRAFMDAIVIFKQDACFIYSYESSPSRGIVRAISTSIGVSGTDCVVEYENNLYLFHDKNVFSMINWNFEKLNVKVPFEYINTQGNSSIQNYCVSLIGDRLIVRYYDTYYVYGLKTKVWTKWESVFYLGRFYQTPYGANIPSNMSYLAASATTDYSNLYSLLDGYTADRKEMMHCSMTTKSFDFESPSTFKRLFWWGVDTLPKNEISAIVYPLAYTRPVTWRELSNYTWGDIQNNTWGQPLSLSISVTNTVPLLNNINFRMFIKFLKSLRFRQINFQLSGDTDGSTTLGPLRIFGITAALSEKAKVSKQIN